MAKNKNLGLSLLAIALGMVMLSYAAVPLYSIFCQVTGFGGETQTAKQAPTIAQNRIINVSFNADTNKDLPWRFYPVDKTISIQVGEEALISYKAENLSNKTITGTAVYNVTPHKAGEYFNKIECFCFTEQSLKAGEVVNMPVSFFIDPEIMNDKNLDDVKNITLSYTFYKSEKK